MASDPPTLPESDLPQWAQVAVACRGMASDLRAMREEQASIRLDLTREHERVTPVIDAYGRYLARLAENDHNEHNSEQFRITERNVTLGKIWGAMSHWQVVGAVLGMLVAIALILTGHYDVLYALLFRLLPLLPSPGAVP